MEGSFDYSVYSELFDLSKCYLVQSYGRTNLLEALECLNAEKFPGVVGIADSDFWRIHGGVPSTKNLAVTDHHDLEILIFMSDALNEFLQEYGSSNKIRNFFADKSVKSPRTWLFRQADFGARTIRSYKG